MGKKIISQLLFTFEAFIYIQLDGPGNPIPVNGSVKIRQIHQDSPQKHQAVCRETWLWAPVDISAQQRPKTHSESGEEMVSGQKHERFAVAQKET